MAGRLIIPNSSLLSEEQAEKVRDALDFSSTFDENTNDIRILIAQLFREFSESQERQQRQIVKLKGKIHSLELLCTVDDLKDREEEVTKQEKMLRAKEDILDFREETLRTLQNSIDFDSNFMYQQRQLIEELRKKLGYKTAVGVTPSSATGSYYNRREYNDNYDADELPF